MGIPNDRQNGQILVMFAITVTAMLAIIGLLYSFGAVLSQRRALQSAADAASLGGTWQVLSELASDNRSDANVLAIVQQYATANGAAAANVAGVYVDAGGTQLGTLGAGGQFATGARGVRVTLNGQVPTILPGFEGLTQLLVQDSATAAARPTVPPTASTVIPIAISTSAYNAHGTFDLFGGQGKTLNLAASGAPTFGATSTDEQYWSDGQHAASWQLSQPATVNLADAPYYASIAAGLKDNVRRQALTDAANHGYGLLVAPVFDASTSTSVHVVGFVELKIVGSTITPTSAPVTFVPYSVGAYGTPTVPSPDLGATLIGLIG